MPNDQLGGDTRTENPEDRVAQAVELSVAAVAAGGSAALSHGDTFTITGTGFGSHDLDVEFLGGATGHLETTNVGTDDNFGSWAVSNEFAETEIVDESERGKVWFGDAVNPGSDNVDRRFNYGSGIPENTDVYVSWWSKIRVDQGAGTEFQWKMLRVKPISSVSDTAPEIVQFNWIDGGSGNQFKIRSNTGIDPTAPGTIDAQSNSYPDNDEIWTRQELVFNTGTQSAENASCWLSRLKQGVYEIGYDSTGIDIYQVSDRHQYFIWQNGFYNFTDGGTFKEVWEDDHYIQVGTTKRVELTDTDDLATSTIREIQKPVTWADRKVTGELNTGGQSAGTYYLHVVEGQSTSLGFTEIEVA